MNGVCYKFNDLDFLTAEKRGGVYGFCRNGKTWILTDDGWAVLVPPPTAEKWQALPLEEDGIDEPWTAEDAAADARRQRLDRM